MEVKIVNNEAYYGERLIGRFNKNILFVNRKRDKHLHIKRNAYGLNRQLIDEFKNIIHYVHLTDEFGTYRLDTATILNSPHYQFDNFEDQYFVSLFLWEENKIHNWAELDLNRIELMGESWYIKLKEEFDKDYLKILSHYVKERRMVNTVYPERFDVFKAFKSVDYDDVKVVIVGQDPYHDGTATGLAFANKIGPPNIAQVLSPSLKRIESALELEYGFHLSPIDPTLNEWSNQGVLLINTVLTVERGKPNSHANIGWQRFVGTALNKLNNDKLGLVFMCWGTKAQKFVREWVNPNRHLIIDCEHPAAGIYEKPPKIWINRYCFSKCNQYLINHDKEPIKWLSNLPKHISEDWIRIQAFNANKAKEQENQQTLFN